MNKSNLPEEKEEIVLNEIKHLPNHTPNNDLLKIFEDRIKNLEVNYQLKIMKLN